MASMVESKTNQGSSYQGMNESEMQGAKTRLVSSALAYDFAIDISVPLLSLQYGLAELQWKKVAQNLKELSDASHEVGK